MPPVIVGIAAGVAAAGVVSTAAAIAIGIGAAALTYAATPKFDGGSFANEAFSQQQMLRSPVEPRRGIYGRAMVSGPLVFAEETGTDNAYLHLVIPLAGHRCDGVEKIYFGDEVAWANGALTSKYASVARLKIHLGNQTTSDPDLTAECSQWTSAHVGFGVTYLYARLKFDTKVFPNGVPNIKALVRGKQVFDPRNANHDWEQPTTWTWSDNWALCCLDYNRFESGVGAAAHEIDLSYFAAAANDSDQLVEYQAGKFEKRYTCNGTYNQDVSPSSIMEKMLTAGAGMHVYVSGQYRLYAGVYQGPEVLVLTEDDAAGDIDVRPYTPRAELCNAVRGTFVDPENFYQPTDFPPYESSYYRAQDDGEYIDHDLDLPFTQSVWTAQRLGKLYLEQKRAGMQISMPIKMIGVAVSVGKVVGLSLPRLGIDGTFQIVDWQFDYGKPVSLILVETSPELFDYAMGSYTERDLTPNVILPNPATVPTPVGLQYLEYQDDPQWQGELTWSAPANNSSYRYVIEVSNGLGEVIYQTNADATRLLLPKFDTGFYTVSVWALNLFANRSNVPATLTIGATLPAPVMGIEVIAGPLTLTLRPTTAAAIAQTTQFEVLGGLSNNIVDAAVIGTGKEAVWPDRHANTAYHVWARTVNNYGVSSWYGPVVATTSADNSSIIDLIGNTFKSYTWFAWADDASGTGFTTVEALGDGKAYMGIATDKDTASPSGNWQEYTWTKIHTDIPPVFTPEEETKLDNLMAGKLPFAPDKDMLAAQDALNNPALANNLITALSLLNQGINAPALGGETPSGSQSKASSAQSAAIAAAATDATTKANNAKAAAESYALAKANLAETTAKAYADGIVSDEEARAIADAQAKANAAQSAAIAAAAADATSKANNAKAQAEASAALDALNKANTARDEALTGAQTKIDGLSIGGANLINNTKSGEFNALPVTVTAETYLDFSVMEAIFTTGTYLDSVATVVPADSGLEYTLSFYAKSDRIAQIHSYFYNPNTTITALNSQGHTSTVPDGASYFSIGTEWQRCWVTWSQSAPASLKSLIVCRILTLGAKVSICGVKFEQGNKATAWSPSEGDVQSKADAAKAAAIEASAADATTKANNAKTAAETYALTKANLAETTAKAYADGIVDIEESRAIADAQAKADAARNTAITAANDALNSRISAGHATGLNNLLSDAGLPYRTDLILFGDSDKYYPVVFSYGDQSVNRRIKIWRGFGEHGPDDWYIPTHKGHLNIDWFGNFGGWGGAGYFEQLISMTTEYTVLLADAYRFGSNMFYCFMLRGGGVNGAVYHIASDLDVMPTPYYNQELLHASAAVYAPAPIANVNWERINNLKLGNATFANLLGFSAQFNQLKSQIGNFGGLTADTIAALAIATHHLDSGAVTADKLTADTALIQKLISNSGLFNQLQAQLAAFGGLAANSIAAKAITVDKLDVLSRNLVNNFSLTGDTKGWTGLPLIDHWHNGQLIKAMEVTTPYNLAGFSDNFEIDHTKVYEINFSIYRVNGGPVGWRYFGIAVDGNGTVQLYDTNGGYQGDTTNFYFWYGQIADGETRKMRAYIVGSEVDISTVPESLNVYHICKLNPSIKNVQLRALNWDNGGVVTTDRWLNPSVTVLGGGQISANQILANSALFDKLKARIGAFGGLTANEIQADTALINKLVGTSGLFNDLVARLAVFGGLTANSIASDAILGRHIKAGEKITSPIIEGGEVRLIGTNAMKIESATPFGPDNLVYWRGPRLLVGGNPDWANISKSNATRWTDAAGDEYFGGSLSAGVLKTGVTNPDKNPYAASSYPVTIGPFGSNGKAKNVVISFALSAVSQSSSNPGSTTQPQLSWQLQRKIGSGSWGTVSSGVFNGAVTAFYEGEAPAHWEVDEHCNGSFTFTDNTLSTSDFNYRVLVVSYTRFHVTSNVIGQTLTLVSIEQ